MLKTLQESFRWGKINAPPLDRPVGKITSAVRIRMAATFRFAMQTSVISKSESELRVLYHRQVKVQARSPILPRGIGQFVLFATS